MTMKTTTLSTTLATLLALTTVPMVAEAATTPQAQAQSVMQAASTYMTKAEMTKLQNWTVITNYAANHVDSEATWDTTTLKAIQSTTDVETQILGLLAAHLDPHDYKSIPFVQMLSSRQTSSGEFADDAKGTLSGSVTGQAFAILALEDTGSPTYSRTKAVSWLLSQQNKDGGFPYQTGATSDTNTTSYAIDALLLTGLSPSSPSVQSAVKYLVGLQQKDGGFAYDTSSKNSDSDSTGTVVDALTAVGVKTDSLIQGNESPLTALLSFADGATGGAKFDNTGGTYSGVSGYSTRDEVLGLGAYLSGKSIFQRLQTVHLTTINAYWTQIESAGGMKENGQWVAWSQLKDQAAAGSYTKLLNSYWTNVLTKRGYWTTENGKTSFVAWSNGVARQALLGTFGWNAVDSAGL